MQCEICGTAKGDFTQSIIEGAILNVCNNCSKFGAVIQKHSIEEPVKKIEASQGFRYHEPNENIVENYATLIKEAREKKKINQEELANAIAEKSSIVYKIESGTLTPEIKMCKKLEQFLGIKLINVESPAIIKEGKKDLDFKNKKLTIGDVIRLKFDVNKK